ncbi:MAG: hypothetical protein RLZZ203_1674 [Cyanobacteriota bacterium]
MYQSNVELYYQSQFFHHEKAKHLIEGLNLKGNEKILDIGCGDGKITAEIAAYVPDGAVLGIDNYEPIINFARTKFPENIYSNLSFVSGDAQNLNFINEFDIIVCFGSLHIIVNHLPVFLGIVKSLKNLGKFALIVPCQSKPKVINSVVADLIKNQKWQSSLGDKVVYGFYEPEQYCQLLKDSGLNVEKINTYLESMTCETKEIFETCLRHNWISLSSRIPTTLYEDFMAELIEKYLVYNPLQDDGAIIYQQMWLELEATKTTKA